MYGWDSYFIIRGLLRAGRVELARGMVDNFFFEIEHYGAMLNANRTYYLTRSQPPFLSSMFVDVYRAMRMQKNGPRSLGEDRAGWSGPMPISIKTTSMWTRDPHLAGQTGLSRYYDFGEGPPAEAVQDESGFYRKVAQYFFLHPPQADDYVVETEAAAAQPVAGAPYTLQVCDVSTDHGARRVREGEAVQTERGLLQRRPLHARVRLRRELPLRPLRRGHASLCPRLPEQPALQNRKRSGADQPVAGPLATMRRNGTNGRRRARN